MASHSFYVRRVPPLEISGVEKVWPVERRRKKEQQRLMDCYC